MMVQTGSRAESMQSHELACQPPLLAVSMHTCDVSDEAASRDTFDVTEYVFRGRINLKVLLYHKMVQVM